MDFGGKLNGAAEWCNRRRMTFSQRLPTVFDYDAYIHEGWLGLGGVSCGRTGWMTAKTCCICTPSPLN